MFRRNAHAILSQFTLYDHRPTKILPDITFLDAAAGFDFTNFSNLNDLLNKILSSGECHSVALANGSPTDLFVWGGSKNSILLLLLLIINSFFLKISKLGNKHG